MTKSTSKNKRTAAISGLTSSRPRRKQARIVRSGGTSKPKALDELLRQVALVSPDAVLPDLIETYKMVLDAQQGPQIAAGRGHRVRLPSPDIEAALGKALDICLQGQDELADYIHSRSAHEDRPPGAPWFWYMFIREAREKLRNVIQGRPVPGISVGSDGIIRTQRDQFAEAVDEVDSTLLRECARSDCRRIFFAKQAKSKYCSEKCRHLVANRLLRFLEKEGFGSGVKLTKKDLARKTELIDAWKEANGIPKDVDENEAGQDSA
jgi:hypothetical protein